jgi:predicted methyltransferase
MRKHRILACLLTLPAIAATPAAFSQTAPDYAAIVAAPDRSEADRKLDTNRAPAQWLAFIGGKPGMKILDVFAVYGWKAELMARAVAPDGKVYAQNSEAAFARVKNRLDARLKNPAAANIIPVVRPFEDPAPPDMHDFDLVTFFYAYHDVTYLGVDRAKMNKAFCDAMKPGGANWSWVITRPSPARARASSKPCTAQTRRWSGRRSRRRVSNLSTRAISSTSPQMPETPPRIPRPNRSIAMC